MKNLSYDNPLTHFDTLYQKENVLYYSDGLGLYLFSAVKEYAPTDYR